MQADGQCRKQAETQTADKSTDCVNIVSLLALELNSKCEDYETRYTSKQHLNLTANTICSSSCTAHELTATLNAIFHYASLLTLSESVAQSPGLIMLNSVTLSSQVSAPLPMHSMNLGKLQHLEDVMKTVCAEQAGSASTRARSTS